MEEIILTRKNIWTLYDSIRETKYDDETKELIGNLIDLMHINNLDSIKISF